MNNLVLSQGATTLTHIGDWILYITTGLLVVLCVYYHLTASWWKSAEGRHVMAWTVCTAAIFAFLTSAVSGRLTLDGKLWVRIVVYGLFFLLGVWRFVLIARAQRQARQEYRAGGTPPSAIPPMSMYPDPNSGTTRRNITTGNGNDVPRPVPPVE